uniref:Uncharacterized protein n=1 Tax=Oryza rufipogon TaxID=4529 RepID=A0A0E0QJ22_ORYRU
MAAPPRARGRRPLAARATAVLHAALRRASCRVATAGRRLAALYALLGALWVASALYIANAVARCARLGMGGASLLSDDRCRVSLEYAPAIVLASLLARSVLRRREAKDELGGGGDGGGDVLSKKLSSSMEAPHHPQLDEETELQMLLVFVLTPSLGLTLFGSVLVLLPPPDPALVPLGSTMANVGLLGVSITLCILGIPYSMRRLRKALSVKAGGIGMV